MKYLYLDPNYGILQKSSIKALENEWLVDKRLPENCDAKFEFIDDEYKLYEIIMKNGYKNYFYAGKVSNKIYRKIKVQIIGIAMENTNEQN